MCHGFFNCNHLIGCRYREFCQYLRCRFYRHFNATLITLKIILCLWFRAKLIHINNCPTRCNTKQFIYYFSSSLYMFRVSTTPIIRSTQNCNYSLQYCAATSLQCGQAWPRWREVAMTRTGGCSYSFVYS